MRLTEAIYTLNIKRLPTPREFREIFTHISREDAIEMRKLNKSIRIP